MSGFTKETVEIVLDRERDACARCGKPLTGPRGLAWSIHHRVARGMGGTKRADVNCASSAVALCGSGTTGCHGWVEANRKKAVTAGFIVSKFGPIAADVPITHVMYGEVFLLPDGEVARVVNSR